MTAANPHDPGTITTNDHIRRRILADHAVLRLMLEELERTIAAPGSASASPSGDVSARGRFRRKGAHLLELFAAHIAVEDAILVGALRRLAGGNVLANALVEEHREQRELLQYLIDRLEDAARPDALVARELRSFCELLRLDMAHEEETLLTVRVLHDR